ncbi:hypothetical protein IU449_27850 [Nocardia higoensis]|uniref:Toprim domain-containing protein n=1 Tax=Nocardia higoensis TaxID=228599 RepID=A0ABS0DIN9_9NOCA|nr:hypothetical protein [Nocardia higoensis]MBF6358317.1 hypothetical protein [Nocardia higoensis]
MAAPAHEAGQGSWVRVTTALEQVVGPGRPAGSWTRYCCPVHEGDGRHHRPSLSVKYFADAGRTKVRCQAGCEDEQVLDAVGLRVADLYDTPLRRGERGARSGPARRPAKRAESRSDRALRAAGIPVHKPKRDLGAQVSPWKATATYTYVRDDGTVAGEVIRREAEFEGGRDKSFSQRSWNPATGGWERTGFDKIPFQLPQVREAIAAGRTIYLVEGEKDALNAATAGLVATTNAGGASGWSPEHAAWLRGARTVVIVADRDAPGYYRADRVMATLSGLVGRVRVVQAATGKDLTDHLAAGHRIADLVPIPHLDPYTRALTAVPTSSATTTAAVAGPAPPPSAVSPAPEYPAEPPSVEGHPMPESLLTPAAETTPHSDEVDHMHSQWSVFMKLLMQQMLLMATKAVHQRAAAAAEAARQSEQAARDAEERAAAEMAAVEVRLRKLRQKGYDSASRTEIADAVRDAATWGDQSEVAGNELGHLALHVSRRWGVELDLDTGQASIAPGADAQRLAEIEQERAAAARARKAQDRMVEMVAREGDLDESAKVGIYAAIETWRADPSAEKLDALTRQLKDRKVPEQTRTRLRFVAAYLGTPAAIGDEENADIKTVSAAEELSRHAAPLVDPGEEAKPRIDKLLETYQEQLKVGAATSEVREELAREVAVLTVEDQEAARARGKAIRANPAGAYPRMWPDHVDRDELDEHIRVYALLAPKAEQAAGMAGDLDDVTATQLAKQAAGHKTAIRKALTDGKGLHDLERDQIKAVLRDVEAGKPAVPEQLFADDRSAAIVDIQRTQRIAYNTSRNQRRDLDEILDTGAVPEPVRQQVREHLDNTTGAVEMAHRGVADAAFKWARRREAVIVSRTAAVIEADGGYDSPQRAQAIEEQLRTGGLDDDQIAERMAAESSFATPPSAAAKPPKLNPRTTSPGAGMQRINHRNKNNGPEQGNGR